MLSTHASSVRPGARRRAPRRHSIVVPVELARYRASVTALRTPRDGNNIPEVRITPPNPYRFPDLSELITYREVFYFLVRKSIASRYKQTLIGLSWVVLQPLSMMVVLVIFFGTILDLHSDGFPLPLFIYSALVSWQYFSGSITESMASISRDRDLIHKVYFPRLFLPLIPLVTHLVDLVVSMLLLAVLMFIYGASPRSSLIC